MTAALTPTTGVVRAGLLSMVGLVALGGTRLVHGALVTRATDHDTYAQVGVLIGLAMTASLFLPGGLSSAASRFISFQRGAGDPDAARTAYRLLTIAGYTTAILLGALVAGIALLLPGVTGGDAVAVAALTAVYSAYSVAKGALYGFDRVVPYTWLEIAGSVVAIAATVVVVSTGAHDYLAPLTIGYAVLMLGALVVLRAGRPSGAGGDRPAVAPPLDRGELTRYVGLASLGGVASAGLLQVLPVLAGQFTTRTEVAFFAAAVTLVAPLFFLPRALGLALFPAMARAHGAGDQDEVRRQMDVSTRALLALLAPLFAAGILLAPLVIVAFGGSDYADGAPVLRLLLVATFTGSIQVAAVNSLSSGDAVRIPVYAAVAGAVVGLAALVPLGTWFGAAGVGAAYLVAVAITSAVPLVAARRRYRLAWAGVTARSFTVVVAALAAGEVVEAVGGSRVVVDLLAAAGMAALGALVLRRDITGVLAARRA